MALNGAYASAGGGDLEISQFNSGTNADGTTFWRGDGLWATPSGGGNVSGPGTVVDNRLVRFNGTTGTLIQQSGITISDTDNITGIGSLTATTLVPTNITGWAIGSNVQAWDADLDAISVITSSDGMFIVGSASGWVGESGSTVRASLGLAALAVLATVDTAQIDNDSVTYAKIQNVVADDRILGNIAGAGGVVAELTAAEVLTLINVEAAADVTDATNVTSAGALMDSEVTNLVDVKAFDTTDYATAAQGATADSALQSVAGDSSPQLAANLDLQTNGFTIALTADVDVVLGDVCIIDGSGEAAIGDADVLATADTVLFMAAATIAADASGAFYVPGSYVSGLSSLTVGATYYLSLTGTSTNTLTSTRPAGSGDIVRVVGVALTTTVLWFQPSSDYATV